MELSQTNGNRWGNYPLVDDFLNGHTLSQVATRHNLTTNAVKMRLRRIKQKAEQNNV
jgi:hypothetical protein